jgi:two-component system, chemotaxis family, chemotaxis protein CheY
MKILVAEDNAISQELLRKILVNRGYEVVVAGDGRVAWDLLCQGLNPDLCILDIMMPVMSGLEVLQRVRKDPRFKRLKIILCSALRDRETIAQGATLGIEYYILKPFKPDIVIQQVEKALQGVVDSPTAVAGENVDEVTLIRSITSLSDEIARGIGIAKAALTNSPLANGAATFHNEDSRKAFTPPFDAIRTHLQQIEAENQKLRKKTPELNTAALAI